MQTNKLPEGYKEGVPRVSDVVSYIYPFDGNSKKRYQKWLKENYVDEDAYLKEAQTVGTFIHQCMEDYITMGLFPPYEDIECPIIKETIEKGIEYIESVKESFPTNKGRTLIAEPVLIDKDERYQGSSDLVLINEKKKTVVIIDWKTFGIAKAKWGLDNKYKKPYDKIKKGRLQFSLYGETFKQKGYEVEDIILVYLHQTKAYPYELKQYTKKELDRILEDFALHKKEQQKKDEREDLIIIRNTRDMKITLRKPTEQYGYMEIEIDGYKLEDGKTLEDKIDEAKALIKYTLNKE